MMKRKKLHIKKGDNVQVIAGNYSGQQGKVLIVMPDTQKAIVEGINMVSKHSKPNAKNTQGGIVKKEAPVHISNLMVVDSTGKPVRVGRGLDKNNKSIRISKKSGEEIK
jgi:large subunit ribosomal protein L24